MKKALLIADDTVLLTRIINRLFFVLKDGLGYENLPDSAKDLFELMDTELFIDKVNQEDYEYLDKYCEERDVKIISPSVGVTKKKNMRKAHEAFDKYVNHIQTRNKDI